MITAAVAPVIASSNHEAAWATVFALLTVFAICAVLYQHERRADRHENVINEHDEQLATLAYQMPALLEFLGIVIEPPVDDDSPGAMAAEVGAERCDAMQPGTATHCQRAPGHMGAHMDLFDQPWISEIEPLAVAAVSDSKPDEMPTDEIPIAPPTVPDGIPLQVQSALIEQRPSPVPREIEYVERTVNIGGTLQTYRIPKREEAS